MILLIGGAGFIGSKVAQKLVEKGEEVVIYDGFIQYVSPITSKYNDFVGLRFADIHDKVTIIRGDIRNPVAYRRVVDKYQPRKIVQLAALPIADLSNTNAEETKCSIVDGTFNILEGLRDKSVEKFIYISSSMVYGDFQKSPCPEDHPKAPKDLYGGFKLAGEIIVESYGRRFDIPWIIIRPSAVYGPTDVNRRVSQILLNNAMEGKPLVLNGNGLTNLDFTYVDDIADGIVCALNSNVTNEAMNITYGHGYTLAEYAAELQKHFNDLSIQLCSNDDHHRPKRGPLDISKAKSLIGYVPRINLSEGVRRYVEWENLRNRAVTNGN